MRKPWKWLAQHGLGFVVIIASYLTVFLYIALGIAESIAEWRRELPAIKKEVERWSLKE